MRHAPAAGVGRGRRPDRPRGTGGLLVTRAGKVGLSVEGRGKRVIAAEWMEKGEVLKAKEILAAHLRGEKNARYLMLPDIGERE